MRIYICVLFLKNLLLNYTLYLLHPIKSELLSEHNNK